MAPVGVVPAARPDRWAGVRRRLATTGAVTASLLSSTATLGLAGVAHQEFGVGNPLQFGLGYFLAVVAGVALVWRYRFPWVVWGLAVLAPVVAVTDALAALVALVGLVRLRPPRQVALAVAGTWVAASVSLSWDAHRDEGGNSALLLFRGAAPVGAYEVPWFVPLLVAAVLVGATTGLGLLLRTTSALAVAERTTREVRTERSELREEVVRAEERSRLARDIHDGLSTLLTRISLHAGALQVRGYPGLPPAERAEVLSAAELIWDTAHEAVGALSDAVGVLRGPEGRQDPPGVDAVPALVRAARQDGVHVVLTLDVAAEPPAAASQLAHRVVREALGNARNYAGARHVLVRVAADPGTGVAVEVRSLLPARPPVSVGTGTGLLGLAEAVHAQRGRLLAGPRGDEFLVEAWLPWELRGPVGPAR